MTNATSPNRPAYDHHPGTGPTLVFLHYWGGSSRTWRPVLNQLPGRATLTIDARGWSRSRTLPGPYTLHQLAHDTRQLITETGLTDYVLIGHSMGGKVAQLVAAERPAGLTGLILVAPAPAKPAATITPDFQHALARAYDTDESTATARDTILTATPLPDDVKAQVLADSRASAPEARTEWPLHGIAEDITTQAGAITVPTLVIAGEHDHVEPPEILRANLLPHLPHATLHEIPRTGHLIPLEAPTALAHLIASSTVLTH